MSATSTLNGNLSQELVELFLGDFFSFFTANEKFLKEFQKTNYCRKVLKRPAITKVRDKESGERGNLVNCCLESSDFLVYLVSFKTANGFSFLKKLLERISIKLLIPLQLLRPSGLF